jgi:invasion protein IalB
MSDNLNVPRLYAVVAAIVCLAIGGIGGYFLRGADRIPGHDGVPVKMAKPAAGLPPGYKPLPVRNFGHWNVVCLANDQGNKLCDMVLRVVDKNTKKLLMSLVISNKVKTSPVFVVITPPSVKLPEGVKVEAEGKAPAKLTFSNCNPGSCEAGAPLDDAIKDVFGSSAVVSVAYVAAGGRLVRYQLPVDGFGAGYAAWLEETK